MLSVILLAVLTVLVPEQEEGQELEQEEEWVLAQAKAQVQEQEEEQKQAPGQVLGLELREKVLELKQAAALEQGLVQLLAGVGKGLNPGLQLGMVPVSSWMKKM